MSSFTIHDLDESLAALIRAKAKADGESMNRTIKRLLEEALGIKVTPPRKHRNDFEKFCGIWSKEEAAEFEEAIADLERVDPEDWR